MWGGCKAGCIGLVCVCWCIGGCSYRGGLVCVCLRVTHVEPACCCSHGALDSPPHVAPTKRLGSVGNGTKTSSLNLAMYSRLADRFSLSCVQKGLR